MSILSNELALPAYSGLSDVDAAALLNDPVLAILQPIQCYSIRRYMLLVGQWLDLKRSTSDAAEIARDALEEFDQFDITDPTVLAVLGNILDGLVDDAALSNFDATNKATILAMGDTTESRAQELGIRAVKPGHVQQARAI